MRAFSAVLVLATLCACVSQSPTNYYTLSSEPAEAASNTLPPGVSLGVGPISLPSMLDRNGIVSRQPDGPQIKVAGLDLWAGELDRLLGRTVAERMTRHLGIAEVWASPWDARLRPEYQLRLFVDQFSGELAGPVTLKIKWALLADYGRRSLGAHVFKKTLPATNAGYSGYVQTLNELLADFAVAAAEITASTINDARLSSANPGEGSSD